MTAFEFMVRLGILIDAICCDECRRKMLAGLERIEGGRYQ